MTEHDIECRIRLSCKDFVMANHLVHGVSVLPGVAFLDIVYRVLAAQGIDPRDTALRNVLFAEPVTTRDGFDRELRVRVTTEDGIRRVRVDSRWLRDGQPCAPWRDNARGELVPADRSPAAPLDVDRLKAGATATDDMDVLYARTRREGIRHGDAMTCVGRLYRGDPYLLAELRLAPGANGHEDGFHLHPAKMDAATLVAFGQDESVGAEPFIPFHIGYVHAPRPLTAAVYVHVPRPETPAASGDLLRNDYTLHDEGGRLLAEFRDMSCKRIRRPELITRLLSEVDSPAVDPVDDVVRYLRQRVAAALGTTPAEVATDVGFYDLGLDSVALLRLGEELETLVGTGLYPTLLFEYGDIGSLARHLAATYEIRPDATGTPADAAPADGAPAGPVPVAPAPAVPGAPWCQREVWVEVPAVPAASTVHSGPLVVFAGEADLVDRLRTRAGRVVTVTAAASFAATGPDAYRLDPRDRDQVRRLLDELADAAGYVHVLPGGADPADGPALALWALTGALVDRRPTRPTPVVFLAPQSASPQSASPEPAAPSAAGLAAMAATVAAEVPLLRCRVVTGTADADTVLAELLDDAGEAAVRYRGGARQVRRFTPVEPGPAAPDRPPFRERGVYLVTGGAGALAGVLADHLVDRYHARLVLAGRRPCDDALRGRIERWRERGGDVRYVVADVSTADGAAAAAAHARDAFGRIDGVLHCAGTVRDGLLFRKEAADISAVLGAKVAGTVHLDAATAADDLDCFVLFSSLAGVLPNPGQAEYAYGNGYQLGFARWRAGRADRRGRTLAVAWPLWADGGMPVPADAVRRSTAATGMVPMPAAVGLDVLARGLSGTHESFAVLYGDPDRVPHVLPAAPPAAPAADASAVAVIGLAGRYPQAPDLEAFWRNLTEGRDSIVEVPPERWDHAAYYDPDREAEGRTYGRWGGFLDGVDRFDPAFFGISRRDAERMDPQERLFLRACWHACEDAGYPPRSFGAQPVGVFVGVMWNHYQLFADADGGVAPTAMHAAVANRVSYCLDLHGPSVAVDTACSSSLTALHLAVESIRRGESALALAGGVNVTIHPQKYLQLAQGQFLSDDGRCRSFGADGTGYVPGEGVGAVLLKPLDRALADGDHIYGVIRATTVNHTGRTSGFTVPSPAAQGALIRAAVEQAGWRPDTVGYIEAHGTGTSLGDPVEVAGLGQAFAGTEVPAGSCAIGSVKSNIGHLESAAGIAGLTKVLLQLQHRQLVPSLHATRTNPHIDFAGSPFRVQQVHEAWQPPASGTARRAGISAFGAGGANAHVLVEEAPQRGPRADDAAREWLFVLSARDDKALRAYARRYVDLLDARDAADPAGADGTADWIAGVAADLLGLPPDAVDHAEPLADLGFDAAGLRELGRRLAERWPGADRPTPDVTVAELARRIPAGGHTDAHFLTDLAYTLQVGRTPMPSRLAVVAGDAGELRRTLHRYLDGAPAGGNGFWGRTDAPELADAVATFRAGELVPVAAYWAGGGDVDWAAGHAGTTVAVRRPLPGYPFQEERCWIGHWRGTNASAAVAVPAATPVPAEPVPPASSEPAEPVAVPVDPGAPGGEGVDLRVLDPGIAVLTMRSASGSNMFTEDMMRGLEDAFARIADDDRVRAVVITGTDKVFSMGATPQALETLAGGGSRFTDAPFVYEGMLRCDRPVIAAVRGHASGGGFAFALYADLVVLSREGVYSANFLKYGFTPGMGATYVLEQRLGAAVAAEMFYTGRPFTGDELARRGAGVTFAPQSDVLPAALALARSVAEKSPLAVRVLKQDLAGRALDRLRPVIARESAMHDQVFGAESAALIRQHFAKVDGFRSAAGAPVPVEPAVPQDAAVTAVVQDVLCASLYLDRSEIDPALSFSEMGLDSIGAVELVREVNRAFGLDIDSVAVYDHPTVPRLVSFVRELIARDREIHAEALGAPAVPVTAPPAVPAVSGPVEVRLSDVTDDPASAAEPTGTVRVELRPVAVPPPDPAPSADHDGAVNRDAAVDIAVIGMAGRFPDGQDLDDFWRNLAAGRDSIREVPADRWDVATYFDPDRRAPGRTYSRWAALLSTVDGFDAQFFRISPLEAAAMDPQQRLFLQTAWACLEDAGYAVDRPDKRRWGVFVGCAAGDYLDLLRQEEQGDSAHAFLGNSGSVLAARIAYLLDLTGPTMAIDTACSSSLVALHLACESIRAGECDAAVAGGVALMLTPRMHVLTSKTGMLSPSGRSAPFDASADGIVLGEGSGAVLLKRLDRALADGDQIHGVILGSGVNGDGRTNGITAPSAASQAGLIARVHRRAGVVPEDVTYVEAHGTGTPLGDPIEVKALDEVFGRDGDAVGSCGIGSVKSNIGHTTMAAGIAGLLKVLLSMRYRMLPPSINFATPNPEIDFGRSRLRPVTALEPWRPGPRGRLVGAVSSFGFSGTNAHVVVAEPPPVGPRPGATAALLVPVSAHTRPALARSLHRLAERLDAPDRPAFVDVAYTLAVGRAHLPVRAAFVAADTAELVPVLRSAADRLLSGPDSAATVAGRTDGELAPIARAYLDGAAVDWSRLYRDGGGRRTALPTYPFADERHWVEPAAVPAPAAAVPAPAAAVPAATERAATEPAPAVAMAVPVPSADGGIPRSVRPTDWLVADHVIAGTPMLPGVVALELAADARPAPLRIASVQWLRPFEVTEPRALEVTVEPAADALRFELSGAGSCHVRGRVSTAEVTTAERLDITAVAGRCPQRRTGAGVYAAFAAAGIAYGPSFQVLDEVWHGADEALGTLTVPAARAAELAGRPLHPVPLDGALQTLAVLVGAGDDRPYVPFALRSLDVFGPVPVTGYAHAVRDGSTFTVTLTDRAGQVRVRFNGVAVRPIAAAAAAAATATTSEAEAAPADGMLYVPEWREAAPLAAPPAAVPVPPRRVVVAHGPDTGELAQALASAHRADGDDVVVAPWPRYPHADRPGGTAPDLVYFLACGRGRVPADGEQPTLALFRVIQALTGTAPVRRPLTLTVVLAGAVPVGDGEVRPHAAGLPGLVGSLAAEYPQWTVGCVDVGTGRWNTDELVRLLRREPGTDRLVAIRGGRRLVRVLEPARLPAGTVPARLSAGTVPAGGPFRPGGTYLIVGGTGGIGQVLSRYLARTVHARLAIVGRRLPDERSAALLAEIERLGGRAVYLPADVTDPAALRAVVRHTRRTFGALHGAFHAALVLRDRTLARMDEDELAEVLAPKVAGAVAFGEAMCTERLDFLAFFSSAVSFTDAAGQANYAAASTFEDAYAMDLRRRYRLPVSVVNWGYWGGVGVVADERYAQRLAGFGVGSIAPAEGMAALCALLHHDVPQALVVKANPDGLARLGVEPAAQPVRPATGSPAAQPVRPAAAPDDPTARAREAFTALDALAPVLLAQRLREPLSVPATVAELAARLHVRPEQERLFAAVLELLERSGAVRRAGDRLEPGTATPPALSTPEALGVRYPDLAPHIELLQRCIDALPDVLDGSRGATGVLFPGGSTDLIERVYSGQSSADHYHRMMADQVRTALPDMHRATGRPVRIVEVGAGTGASSAFVLAACADSGVPVEYRYTDISSAFLRRGEDAFAARFPFLRCELLDIERDPVDQGFAEHGYDVVLATNVLHATARVPRTLANARRLLRPGGLLLVNEVTRVSAFVTLTFGLTPGWWRAEDAAVRLPHSPLLGPAQWRRSLAAAGFDPVRTLGFAGTAPDDLEQCLFVAVAAGATGGPAGDAVGPAGDAVRGYVRKVFAEVLRFRDSDLDDRVTFENYGVDSLVSLDILGRFERDLGTLPATLLFEHLTIADLAGHFAATHPEALVALLGVAAAPPAPAPRTALPAGATRSAVRDADIAVVGVVGRYPGAADLDEFWHMLADGRTGVTEVPAHRWDWRTHFDPEKGRAQRTYSRWGGFLDGIDEFDPGFFGILPRDAENIDPQERLFLETAWNLLEQTGYLGEHTREPDTGVFVGTMYGSYGQLAAAGWAHGQLAGATSAYWSIANRVSYFLDLRGPSFAVDSACSSSLLAVHLASESIRRGECRMAIAGGVNVILHPAHFVALSGLNMLSADGRCKVFDARADGFVPGEGVGAVLLKPLSRAVADGDRIWGVIRSGFANAGGKTGGYTVPNPNAQAALVAEAVRRAGVDPATIGYVEAHGTGTELGDPIELAGLSRALGAGTPGGVRCAIGSVKANVGHLEGAAGIAGLTKVLLQLRHGQLAPCANLDEVNPKIELNPDRCYLPTSLTAWPRADGPDGPVPRRAGVSSFGAGGANVHLVVEEYADAESPRPAAPLGTERVFVLSARTRDQLAAFADRVARFLVGPAGAMVDLDALCYTSQVGRRELAERLAVPVRDTAALAAALAAFAGGTTPEWLCTGTAARSDAPVDRSASPADIAARWVRGAAVDWPALWPAPVPRRIPFPTYPFERKRYWMSGPAPATVPAPAAIAAPVTVDAEAVCRFQRPVWVPRAGTPAVWHPRVVLVVTADLSLAEAVAAALRHSGTRCVTAVTGPRLVQAGSFGYAFDPAADDQCAELAQALARRGLLPDTLVHAVADAGSAGSDGLAADLDRGLYPFLRLCTALLGERPQGPLRAVFAHPSRVDGPAPQHVAVAAAVRTLALEHTGFSGTRVEFAHTDGVPPSAAERAARLADEVTAGGRGDMEVCYRDGLRWVKRLEDFTPAPAGGPIVRPGGTYLITGGAGGLGLHVAGYLAGDGPVEVVLAGRKQPGPEAAQRIAALCRSGASVRFERADVTREDELRRLVRDCGTLRGIVHAAGVTRDARAVHKTRADIAAVLAPKVLGTVLLDEVTADAPLDFFALFSSVAAETGNPGQVDYAAANAFLNAFAQLREVRRERGERSGRTVAFGWPLWAEGGMTVDDATRRLMARHWSMVPMRTAVGLDAFRRGLSGGESTFVVVESVAAPAVAAPAEAVLAEAPPAEVAPAVAAPVAAASTERLQETVEDRLRGMAATFLLIDPVEVELSDDLMETGFDSISLTELINQVNEAYGLDLLPTVLFECANLRAFAEYLVRHHATEIGGGTAPAERVPVPEPETPPAVAVPDGAVAIVGIAGTLPGSPDLDTFWRHLAAGDDLVGPAPADRLELHAHPDTAGVRAGFLDDVATFDAELFRISPAEAALMDPQQRLFLQTVWRAVEDAGYRPGSLAGTDTGLFVGVSTTDYADLLRQHGIPVAAHTASGIAHSILANRVSHVLDLRGPSEAVDTACSSSLVAIHRAVQALAAGDCTVAVAGGVNVLLSPGLFTAFTESGMLSPDGACKTFDSGADGYARGEGVGAVVLKPLAAAEACGDHIYAVIRGSAVNHGGRSTSLTAPNPQAQARVLVRAYRTAGVDPLTVTAIEAHGTGTRLGDPVEIEGLKKAFAELTGGHAPQEPTVAVGSVKTNVGHLEAAAGIAGILKTVLAMRYGLLPPSLHFTEPNPYLRLDGTPFFVNDRLRRWDGVPDGSGGAVRRAGVSSFGFGGTNAHVVLESHAVPPPAAVPGEPQLLVLSGRDEPSVRTAAAALADHLERHPDTDLARAAHTLQTGREPLAHRLAVVASEPVEAVHALRAAATGTPDGTVPTTGVPALDDLARRWLAGEDVSWDEWWHGREPGRTPLPGQPLSGRPYWFDGRAQRAGEEAAVPEPAQPQAIPAAVRHRGGKVSLVPPSNGAAPVAPAETATPVVPAVAEPTPVEPAPVRGRDVAAAVRGRDVTAAVRGHVADILGLTADEVDAGRSFVDLGLDSIFRMDLARRLNATFSLDLQAAELYEYDTVDQLAAHLTAAAPDVAPQAMPVPAEALRGAVQRIVDRTVDPALDFTANGLTSFDMLRVVSALERRFGALPKTLLFDHPSVDALAGQLAGTHGASATVELLRAVAAEEVPVGSPEDGVRLGTDADARPAADGAVVVRKRDLVALPHLAGALDDIDRRHGKEGGLAGRDIAPLAFVGSTRQAYFNFSRRGADLFAWSYAGSADEFPVLVGEWLDYAGRYGLRANFLSMLPMREVAGVPLTATPFGAVQRITDLAEFTLDGGRMTRLRYLVRKFEHAGDCRTEEYRPGSDTTTDREIADMVGRWGDQKQMVNPYVAVVRDELGHGILDARHRVFLTRVDGELANVVIVTRIPSEPGYLLDLEFYPKKAPRGGLEYAIVSILERLRDEGYPMFSFGASFGVKVCDSPNAAPDVEEGLDELRSVGIFGTGNFQFKNKFRPTNLPIYLCQRADEPHTSVADVILMIANPDTAATAPGMLTAPDAEPQPARPAPQPATEARPASGTGQLAACGYNPLALRHADVAVDLITDSWAELDSPAILARATQLHDRARRAADPAGFPMPDWLPFDHAVPTGSGRQAEALLCRNWPGPRGTVIHTELFPTWALSLADAGFTALRTPTAADRRPRTTELFQGDLDLAQLRSRLAATNGGVSFVCVELSGNAGGGYPISMANLRAVREAAVRHGVPVVVDATRIVENAMFITGHEDGWRGRDVWAVVRELLALADTATFSLSKDFGVPAGGLVATRTAALADRLREHEALRGRETGLLARKLLACALDDRAAVAAGVAVRMDAVRTLWTALADAGVPVVAPASGHCVLLDVDRMPSFAGLSLPVESCLAWLYGRTGVRGGPHLSKGAPERYLRLAVPVGFSVAQAADVAERLVALWRDPGAVPDLVAVQSAGPVGSRYHPAGELPDDIEAAMREGHRPKDDNAAVLRERAPAAERTLLRVPDGEVEVFSAGTGPVLLLVPPFNIGAGVFAEQYAALPDRYRLVTVHHPGVGATTAAADLTLDGIAALYRTALDRLGERGPVHVLGSSFGGLVAQAFALRFPQDCASLVLVGSSYKVGNRHGEVNRLSVVAREDFDRITANGGPARLRDERAGLEELLLRCESMDPRIGLSYLDVFAAQPTLFARLPEIAVPTLILHGRHDTVVPVKAAHLLHGAIPDARYVELAGAGHFPCLTHPDEVHRLLLEFLRANDERRFARCGTASKP